MRGPAFPAATASPLGSRHLRANWRTAARPPTAEAPSTGWRKSTKVISGLPGTEEGPSADVSQRGRRGKRDGQTEIIAFIKPRGDSRRGGAMVEEDEVKGLTNGECISRSV